MPFEGGVWDQPPRLVDEMRLILNVVRAEEARRIRESQRTTTSST